MFGQQDSPHREHKHSPENSDGQEEGRFCGAAGRTNGHRKDENGEVS